MVSYRYNSSGRMTGYTKSSRDLYNEGQLGRIILFLGICALPFAPLLGGSWWIYNRLTEGYSWHELFAGLLAAVPTLVGLYLLWVSSWFRRLYIALYTIGAAIMALFVVGGASDPIWGAFAAVIVLIAGGLFNRALHRWTSRLPVTE